MEGVCLSERAGYGRGAGRQGRGGARGDPGAAGAVCSALGAAQRADQGAVSGGGGPVLRLCGRCGTGVGEDTQVLA